MFRAMENVAVNLIIQIKVIDKGMKQILPIEQKHQSIIHER